MAGSPDDPAGAVDQPRVGVDEWVAQHEDRHARYGGIGGLIRRGWVATPDSVKLFVLVGVAATLPFYLSGGDLFVYGIFTLLYGVLALGLRVNLLRVCHGQDATDG